MTVYNFSAGPAMLPRAVLEKAQSELVDWNGHGSSVMEMSHRGQPFIELAEKSEADLRTLLKVPSQYKVLFMQGGGRGQFFSVPMNLAKRGDCAAHLVTGQWSKIAVDECAKYMQSKVVATDTIKDGMRHVPQHDNWNIDPSSAYFHYCPNETVEGIEINWVPKFAKECAEVPVVADMSSNILSKVINIEDYGIIYAGAQKNIGPSGLSIVIVREDLLGFESPLTPSIFSYQKQISHESMYNTPPTFSWYLASLVFEWLLEQGGLSTIEAKNIEKSEYLYQFIDKSGFYSNGIHPENRSKMNVVFDLADDELNHKFLEESSKNNLKALKGHRAVGGMRASIYNAMELEGVHALVDFMQDFERRYA